MKLWALFRKGIEVFGDKNHFKRWLQKPAFGLGRQVPCELLDTASGVEAVMEELYRIEFGDLA